MITKQDIECYVKVVLIDEAIDSWWQCEVPALDNRRAIDIYADDPEALLSHVKKYVEPGYS